MKRIFVLAAAALTLGSCVSTKVFNEEKARGMRLEGELESTKTTNKSLGERVDQLSAERGRLLQDTARLYTESADWRAKYDVLGLKYEQLLSDGSAEAARMLRQLETSQNELGVRERRVAELEQTLKNREEAISALRAKVADALLGFEGKGLTITQKDGKVYVSMEDKLLFKSGSWDIDPNGATAVKELGGVLAQNPDINIVVEGHTDDVPYKPNGQIQDNLDLSAKRATTVTRLLLENKGIAPSRIMAAGRGEYQPVDAAKTTEARARNRRTDIILTPKLDELMQLMEK